MSTPAEVRTRSGVDVSETVPLQVGPGVEAGPGAPVAPRPRPAGRPAVAAPVRPASRRDPRRPAGRTAAFVPPQVRPQPCPGRVNPTDVIHPALPAAVVVRRRRTVAVVVLAVVLVGLLALAVRLTGESGAVSDAAGSGTGPVPAGQTVVVVSPGETLGGLAGRVAPAADPEAVSAWIRDTNHLSSSALPVGRPLVVPAAP